MKRKRGESPTYSKIVGLLSIIPLLCVLFIGLYDLQNHDDDTLCFNVDDTALIVYGSEIDHKYQTTSQSAIDAIQSMELIPVTEDANLTHRTIDIMLYNRKGLIGSMWLMYNEKSFTWYAQVNDGFRRDCGLYQINTRDMMDTIRAMEG